MPDIEDFYAAADRAGLLAAVRIGSNTIAADFRAPDNTVLDGLALSSDYTIRLPASARDKLTAEDILTIGADQYRVRSIRAIGDGSEYSASLSRL